MTGAGSGSLEHALAQTPSTQRVTRWVKGRKKRDVEGKRTPVDGRRLARSLAITLGLAKGIAAKAAARRFLPSEGVFSGGYPRYAEAMSRPPPIALALSLCLSTACQGQSAPPTSPRRPPKPRARAAPPQPTSPAKPARPQAAPPTAKTCAAVKIPAFAEEKHPRINAALPPLVDAKWLAPFYEALAQLQRGERKRHLRIGVYGDSNLTRDYFTGAMRRQLQGRYGDAGHGIVANVRPWFWYIHMDIRHDYEESAWKKFAISTHRAPDRAYGMTGLAVQSKGIGATTWMATAKSGAPVGTSAEGGGVFYYQWPKGGAFDIVADGKVIDHVDTNANVRGTGERKFALPPGPHRVEFKATSKKPVRLFGSYFENKKPGIVVDSYGIGGAYYYTLTLDDPAITNDMQKKRPLDLLILWMGTNTHQSAKNPESIRKIVEWRRATQPNLPIVLMAPPDQLKTRSAKNSNRSIVRYIKRLPPIAKANKLAYWNTREAMGGNFSMGRYLQAGLSVDQYHLNDKGEALLANKLVHLLWRHAGAYAIAHPKAGCGDPAKVKIPK